MKAAKLGGVLLFCLAILPAVAFSATTTINGQGAIAPRITLTAVNALNFGELAIQDSSVGGFYDIAPNGTLSSSNVTQIGTATRGSVTISGRSGVNVIVSVTATAFACDISYIGSCSGTPTLTNLATDFVSPGQLATTSCTGIRCTQTINIGGRFNFSGTDEGRWTNTVSLTANYQ